MINQMLVMNALSNNDEDIECIKVDQEMPNPAERHTLLVFLNKTNGVIAKLLLHESRDEDNIDMQTDIVVINDEKRVELLGMDGWLSQGGSDEETEVFDVEIPNLHLFRATFDEYSSFIEKCLWQISDHRKKLNLM